LKAYATRQRKVLLAFLQKHQDEKFTVEDLLQQLPENLPVSRSAVYRNIDKMVQDGFLRKEVQQQGRKTFYQYLACGSSCSRLHLQCEKCGKTMHLDKLEDEEKLQQLLQQNGFKLDEHATLIMGICKKCR